MNSQTVEMQQRIKETLLKKGKKLDVKNKVYGAVDKVRCVSFVLWALFITGPVSYLFVVNAKGKGKILETMPFVKLFKAPAKMVFGWLEGITFLDDKALRIIAALIILLSILVVPLIISLLFIAISGKYYKGEYSYITIGSKALDNAEALREKAYNNSDKAKKVSMSKKKALCCKIVMIIFNSIYLTTYLSFCFYSKKHTKTIIKLLKKLFDRGVFDERLVNHFILSAVILIVVVLVFLLLYRTAFKIMDSRINALYTKGIEDIECMSDLCELVELNLDPERSKKERKIEEEQYEKELEKARESRYSSSSCGSYTPPTSKPLTDDEAWWAIASGMMSTDVTGM